ncbi:hypothetical protein [Haladaptatus halobius]|uniref:hypothetical protein n=1 Tax=Haladaptatus halobius TaxID=2884875 RepID=UPI001D09C290|nr:hypothetical protein [Haladaptatus halobius]
MRNLEPVLGSYYDRFWASSTDIESGDITHETTRKASVARKTATARCIAVEDTDSGA